METSKWRKFLCKIGAHKKIDDHDINKDFDMALAMIDILVRGVPWKCAACSKKGRYNY